MTLKEFWPLYLEQHSNKTSRKLHFIGTSIAIAYFGRALGTGEVKYVGVGILMAFAFAWVGHFFFQKNRPATFQHPILSITCDFRLWYGMLRGKL